MTEDTEGRRRGRRPRPEPTPAQRALGAAGAPGTFAQGVGAQAARAGGRSRRRRCRRGPHGRRGLAGRCALCRMAGALACGHRLRALHVRAELGTHGLDREAIVAAMDTYGGRLAGQCPRPGPSPLRRSRATGPGTAAQGRRDLLARRGFDADTIRAASRFDPDD